MGEAVAIWRALPPPALPKHMHALMCRGLSAGSGRVDTKEAHLTISWSVYPWDFHGHAEDAQQSTVVALKAVNPAQAGRVSERTWYHLRDTLPGPLGSS